MAAAPFTPEDLEALLEDAFVLRDRSALAHLFEPEAVVAVNGSHARGPAAVRAVSALWLRDATYIAQPRQVLQDGDTALIVADRSVSVARRAADARWRYALAVLDIHPIRRGAIHHDHPDRD